MTRTVFLAAALFCASVSLCACGGGGSAPRADGGAVGYGPDPQLPPPEAQSIPVMNVAEAVGWPEGAAPTAPAGFTVTRYAEGLEHPRWLHLLPNGDILVAQSASRRARNQGVEGMVANALMERGGAFAAGVDSVVLLRDADKDGDVDETSAFAENLNQPFGMALIGDDLYVANTDAVVRFAYQPGQMSASEPPETVLELPHLDENNGHWTRNLLASPDGATLYVSVGSVSNIGDRGMEIEEGRAAIWAMDVATRQARVFARGLRNPVGLDFEPQTGALWTAVNERDMLGDDLVPDYMTSVREGDFFGWPYSYFGQHVDARVNPQDPALVASARAPDYALGAHTASLGLHFYRGAMLPERYRGGAFVGQHGSWNRRERAGYKVVFTPFADGRPAGAVEDVLTGFLNGAGKAQGRPVGVIEDATGALLVADDVGGMVWRVAYSSAGD